jgi:sulfide:quinone oxidoreductase
MAASAHKVIVVGGGAAGIATAASMLRRRPGLDIAIIDAAQDHFYQPGWTMVGGGIFDPPVNRRSMESVIPPGAIWIRQNVASFDPANSSVTTDGGDVLTYDLLVVAPGIKLDWGQIRGLPETLGRNGVTSNYGYDTSPYTWELVQQTKRGRAICLPSRRCRSSAPARRRRACICRATTGAVRACWAISRCSSAMPEPCCSGWPTMSRR